MTRLCIATPVDGTAVTGTVHAGYAVALGLLLRDNHGLDVVPHHLMFSADIVRARNRAVRMILRDLPNVTDVLWWDSDVVPSDLSCVGGMLRSGEHVIGAPYLRKSDSPRWTHTGGPNEFGLVAGVGFGFTITTTHCLRMMVEASKKYTDFLSDGTEVDDTADVFDLQYETHPNGKTMKLSEDFSFCKRWRDIGGRVALYTGPGSVLSHVGTHAFTPASK